MHCDFYFYFFGGFIDRLRKHGKERKKKATTTINSVSCHCPYPEEKSMDHQHRQAIRIPSYQSLIPIAGKRLQEVKS